MNTINWPMARLRFRWWLNDRLEQIEIAMAKCLPQNVKKWVVALEAGRVTTGKWSDTIVPELTVVEMMKRMDDNG